MFSMNSLPTEHNSTVADDHSVHYFVLLRLTDSVISYFSLIQVQASMYEFICSQSPHSMKGMFIGLSFTLSGAYSLLSPLLALLFGFTWHTSSFPTCGMAYYLVSTVLGFVAVVIYTSVARKYKYRLRDEPCHVRRFVEEYYSKIQTN